MFRLGGISAVAGALLGMVGNIIHPATPFDDPEGVARVIADSGAWAAMHYAIVLGIVLMLGGLVAIHRSIRGGLAGALSRFGLVAAISGATIGLILVILDGVAARQLAQEWSDASTNRDVALALVHANETINFALASLFNLVFAAATFILFGAAAIAQRHLPPLAGMVGGGRGGALVRGGDDPGLHRRADGGVSDRDDRGADDDHAVAALDGGAPDPDEPVQAEPEASILGARRRASSTADLVGVIESMRRVDVEPVIHRVGAALAVRSHTVPVRVAELVQELGG